MRLHCHAEQRIDRDHPDVKDTDIARRDQRQHVSIRREFCQGSPHPGQPADGVQHDGQQQEREQQRENSLHKVRNDRGSQSAGQTVNDKQHGHHNDGRLRGNCRTRARFDDRSGTFQHVADRDDELRQPEHAEQNRDRWRIASGKDIGCRQRPEPPHHRRDQPEERRRKQPHPLIPDPGQTAGVAFRGDGHCLIGMSARAESMHQHHDLAKAARHDEVCHARHLATRPDAQQSHTDQVPSQRNPVSG